MMRSRPYANLPDWAIRLAIKLAPPSTNVHWRARLEQWHREVVERADEDDVDVPAYPVARIEGEQ